MKIYFQPHMENLIHFLTKYPFITLATIISLSAIGILVYQYFKEQKTNR